MTSLLFRSAKLRSLALQHRPRVETLEDRLQLGETVLGVLTGLTLLESLAPAPELSELPALVSPRPLPVTSPGLLDSYSAAAPQSGAIYEIVNHADSPNPTPGGDTADFWPSAGQASPAFWRASGPLGAARQDPFFLSMVPFTGSAGPAAFSAPVQAFPPTFSRTDAPGALRDSASGTDFATLTDSTPLAFDIGTGQLGIHRDANDHTVRTTINAAGFLEVTRAGQLHSSDPASAGFDRALAGAMAANLRAVRFDGGAEDQLAVSASCLPGAFVVRAGAAEVIAGAVTAAGAVSIQAPKVTVTGAVHAPAVSLNATGWVVIEATGEVSTGRDGTGGQIAIVADKFVNSGRVHADGAAGGQIQLHAGNILNGGPISADGTQSGPGGSVQVSFTGVYIGTVAGLTSANSQPEPGASAPGVGGTVIINGGATGRLFSSGKHEATGATGGEVDLLGREIVLPGASIDTSGNNGGGLVHIGGDFHGGTVGASLQLARSQGQVTNLPHNASTVTVTSATTIHADAWQNGDGGRVAVWSEEGTDFSGTASARGGITGGAGGFIEVSSKGKLNFAGSGDAGAPRGQAGKLLMDPKNLVITDATPGVLPQFDLADPNPQVGGRFGNQVTVLSGGNVVVTNPTDNFGGTNAGAAYLFEGRTGTLLSALEGSFVNDQVAVGIITLPNGNYVVLSPYWGGNRGAATWGSGSSGVTGIVSAAISLIGSGPGEYVGGVTVLSNGNYVVTSPNWNGNRGAATWGSGTTGVSGFISAANSLIGSNPNDFVGNAGVTALTNGNYVVRSQSWNGNRGAATWSSGSSGVTGMVSAANSLVGSSPNDYVGGFGFSLTNGSYVVDSPNWNGNRGAATWASGTAGVSGTISAANSLVGSNPNDSVGISGVTALANGNFVIGSRNWNGNWGAATWGSGTTGVAGTVSSANSLTGSNPNDLVGTNVVPLPNGNYVILSGNWNGNRGAVTWGNGTSGLAGTLSAANSLTGSNPNDYVGFNGVTVLTNGNYVVGSPSWNGGRGAATWGSSTAGVAGTVSAANSLTGSNPNDIVGNGGVTALTNGNYVVSSQSWNGNRGAATWGSGTSGVAGTVSAGNSLTGSNPNDQVGGGITTLNNGNYVVISQNWNGNQGAVTWGSGTAGVTGTVSGANSLTGSNPNDYVGNAGVTALSNGNYVVRSPNWNGNRGAASWGSGTTGVTGNISNGNSLTGGNPNDYVASGGVTALTNGNYVARSYVWNGNRGAASFGSGTAGITGTVSTANSLTGSNPNDYVGYSAVPLSNGNYVVSSPYWNGIRGAATWANGRNGQTVDGTGTITLANSIIGRVPNPNSGLAVIENPVYQNFLVDFTNNLGGQVVASPIVDPLDLGYARFGSQTVSLPITLLTSTLNSGTAVVLQASNDITVNAAIDEQGGDLTLQAGRSLRINADISTGGGALTLIANDTLANGVIDAQRDPGPAVITMAPGTTIDTWSAPLSVELRDGAGRTNRTSGAVSLGRIFAGPVSVANNGPTAGSNLLLGPVETGDLQSYSSPNGITRARGMLYAVDSQITFTDSVALNAGVLVSAGNGTVDFTGSGTQTLQAGAGARIENLRHTGPGALQLTSPLNVRGSFTNLAGTFDARNQTLNVDGNWTWTAGSFLSAGGTVLFNGSVDQTLDSGGQAFANLVHQATNSTRTLRLTGNDLTVSGTFRNLMGTFDANRLAVTVQGLTTVDNTTSYLGSSGSQLFGGGLALLNGSRLAGDNLILGGDVTASPGPSVTPASITGNLSLGSSNRVFTVLDAVTTFASGLGTPDGLAFDTSGNLYVANYSSGTVTKVDRGGVITTFASGFTHPDGLAFDTSGNLYVSHGDNGAAVSRVTPGGVVTQFAGTSTGLYYPRGLAFDSGGNLFAADFPYGGLTQLDPSGMGSSHDYGFGPYNTYGLAFDGSGILYVANWSDGTVSKLTSGGVVSVFATGFSHPEGLAFDGSGNLYVANTGNDTVSEVTPAGAVATFLSTGLNQPSGLAFDSSGNLYISNAANNTVVKVSGVSSGVQLQIDAVISGAAGVGLTKAGPGALRLTAANTYSGPTIVSAGKLVIDGSQPNSNVTVNGATLLGVGTAGNFTVNGGTFNPGGLSSTGIFNSAGNVTLAATSTFSVRLNGGTAGSGYDQLLVGGAVNLNGAVLAPTVGFTPALGDSFTILSTVGGVTGTFQGLAEGAIFTVGGLHFQITYVGNGGTDVVLTRAP